jgi:DNA-binding response OmpR family regulator
MKLVLAEDDSILVDALSASLRKAGFDVDLAANGAVAEYRLLRHSGSPVDAHLFDAQSERRVA